MKAAAILASALLLSACAVQAAPPSIAAIPAEAATANAYAPDQAACRKSASQTTAAAVAEEPIELGDPQTTQEYYDAVYAICMVGKGNKVPGWKS